uniref:Uncharacterized protein n=1 Tax=Ditylenchus dipsaci TaxID=166011 RepID=A0A915EHV4_9BILA
MHDYQKAQRHFQIYLQEFPGPESEASAELARVAKRLEEEAGQLDISFLYDAENEGKILRLDIADYNTPVAIADIPGKGKGLVATLDVEPGTLLMVSKAFAVTYPAKEQILVHRKKQGVESVYGGTWIRNMIKVVETLRKIHTEQRSCILCMQMS